MYEKWRDEVDYEDDYNKQLSKVQELQAQIEVAKRDDSLSGQKRVIELMEQLQEEQEALEDLVQNKIDQNINDMIDNQIEHIEENADKIKKGAIVTDVSGVKKSVCDKLFPLAEERGFSFIGGHPMAGVEFSGFDYSKDALFKNASMILVPSKKESIGNCELLSELFKLLGFTRIQFTTPEEHDKMIALTSQLAHVISSAYVKSPSALNHKGFSAGSFRDMTRVARLNESLWSELFFANKENLLTEIDGLIEHLIEYKTALSEDDEEMMIELLKEGTKRKLLSEKRYEKTHS